MVFFPNCKINLGLKILQKNVNGFHDLESIFLPLAVQDALEIINSEDSNTHFRYTGISIPGNSENICVKAYHLLKKDFPQLPEVQIHLHKAIPIGAGLGGGSADATFTLLLLNQKYNLELSQSQLHSYCMKLGSDCSFFLYNKPCLATGRGEILTPIDLSLKGYKIALSFPGIHISTAEAFRNIQFQIKEKSILEIAQQPITTWKDELKNDFENTIFLKHPSLNHIKMNLYEMGAVYASMTGTGSCIYGIFKADHVIDPLEDQSIIQRWIHLN